MSDEKDFHILAQELHKGIRRKFPRRKVYSPMPDWIWSCDLIDYNLLKKENLGFAYLLVCCDVFSKYVRAVPLRNKDAKSMFEAFYSLQYELPKFIWVDQGKEFYNKKLEAFLKFKDVQLYSTYSESKSVIAERFNRTFKNWMARYFTRKNTLSWIEEYKNLINIYNNRKHSTTKAKPKDVVNCLRDKNYELFEQVYENLYGDYNNESTKLPRNALKVGDYVRISRLKSIFEKGYDYNWSEEIFRVRELLMTNPVTYKIEDYNGEDIQGTFYRQELVKTTLSDLTNTFRIEKVLKEDKKNKRVLVKWKGWPVKFNSWLPKEALIDI